MLYLIQIVVQKHAWEFKTDTFPISFHYFQGNHCAKCLCIYIFYLCFYFFNIFNAYVYTHKYTMLLVCFKVLYKCIFITCFSLKIVFLRSNYEYVMIESILLGIIYYTLLYPCFLSMVTVTCSLPWSKIIKWEILEINIS